MLYQLFFLYIFTCLLNTSMDICCTPDRIQLICQVQLLPWTFAAGACHYGAERSRRNLQPVHADNVPECHSRTDQLVCPAVISFQFCTARWFQQWQDPWPCDTGWDDAVPASPCLCWCKQTPWGWAKFQAHAKRKGGTWRSCRCSDRPLVKQRITPGIVSIW